MAANNRTLGRFDLIGIPPAPRGIPQIEVTFDIDANGIVHVSAKDKATGKEQSIRIESSSGLSKEEVEKMQKDAKEHEAEDKKKRELVESRNQLDSLVYATEKALKDYGDKVSDDEKKKINKAIEKAKKSLQSENVDEIKKAQEELQKASYKLSEEMYKQAQAEQQKQAGGAQGAAGQTGGAEQAGEKKGKEDVVDADFKVDEGEDKDKDKK
jgi:molecular chaperone DnaK